MKVRTAQGYQPCIVAGLNSEVVVPRLTAVGQNQHLSLTQNDDFPSLVPRGGIELSSILLN